MPASSHSWYQLLAELSQASPAKRLSSQSRAARDIKTWIAQEELPPEITPLRIGLIRSVTAELLLPPAVARLAEYGFAAQIELGQLGNIAAEILADDSFVYRHDFDVIIVLALGEHLFPELADPGFVFHDDAFADSYFSQLSTLADKSPSQIIVANFTPPADAIGSQLSLHRSHSQRYARDRLNRRLAEFSEQHPNMTVWDLDGVQRQLGCDQFWSTRDLATSLQPFTPNSLDALAKGLAEVVLLYRSTPVKCVVLDCDNTLWGGIVGEDGLNGIQLGESYPGFCFQSFQRQLVHLNRLGFLLAINSKNNLQDVLQVIDQHPGMLLKREHFAAIRANWQNKVSNLRELASELNIGLDSFVFIDDSEFEVEHVRSQLPEVLTLKTPAQPWDLTRVLANARVIDRLRLTNEDRGKAEMYQAEAKRRDLRSTADDLSAYLDSLQIEMFFEPFDESIHLGRAAQLTQKTNQFNLTTRRYTEADIQQSVAENSQPYLARLQDRFGEYGRIILAIVKPSPDPGRYVLDTFLMSCRVIGRGVEQSFLRLVMQRLSNQGATQLDAEFIPTSKNAVCKDFLKQAGFEEIGTDSEGVQRFSYDFSSGIREPESWLNVHG